MQDYSKIAADFNVERFRQINYEYDLISGKVNKVAYQPGKTDGFYHRYHYDAENRITQVYTSRDGFYWERDAAYSYYRNGPLQRTVLGQLNVQGIDYAYTLQGWLKGVNSTTLNPDFDMGEDGKTGSPVARDVYSFGLHYYENSTQKDYKPTGTNNPFASAVNSSFKSLYNGNIAAMSVNLGALKQAEGLGVYNDALLYNYRYDQLNRIKEMQAYNGLNISTNSWTPTGINDYKELISYDPNGNILTYLRNGTSATNLLMDNMTYHYNTGNNQLNHVTDIVPSGNYSVDIDNQSNNNYEYDAIGNLIKDVSEGITGITWNVYGKISSITKTSGTISYTYDATGNRISKTVGGVTTLYVRDAGGNVMSVYEIPSANTIVQKELHIYGSSRLGMITGELDIEEVSLPSEFGEGKIVSVTRGKKYFELPNHLGNLLAVISDKRIPVTGGVYEADIVSATDYAPFGMGLVGRSYSSEEYRYGFNGQEKSYEIESNGNNTTAEFWQYESRLGRRWNTDPIYTANISKYAVNGNSPIFYLDPKGDFKTKFGAAWYKLWNNKKGTIQKNNNEKDNRYGEWYIQRKGEVGKRGDDNDLLDEVIIYSPIYKPKKTNTNIFGNPRQNSPFSAKSEDVHNTVDNLAYAFERSKSALWNSPVARLIIPDYYTFSFHGSASSVASLEQSITFTVLLRGKDPGIFVNTSTSGGIITEISVNGGISVGSGYFYGK